MLAVYYHDYFDYAITFYNLLLNLSRVAAHAPDFLKLLWFACWYACVCLSVCPPPKPLIASGVIWCDIGHVRLVKQVLRLSPAFNYFI